MQINRLFEIVYLLTDKKRMTIQALADHFEVSTRTIHRDIDVLAQAGIPLYTTRGKGGGISLLDGFVLNKTILTGDDRQQILMSLQSLPATGTLGSEKLLAKLGAFFESPAADWIEVDFSRWGQSLQDTDRFSIIKSAILSQAALQFEYIDSAGRRSERTVYPLKLVFKYRAWYLQGYCLSRNDYRTFKVNRMLKLDQGSESFDRTAFSPLPLENADKKAVMPEIIELLFTASNAYRVYDEFDEGCIELLDDGTAHIMARLPVDDWLLSYLASFGEAVEVVRPKHLNHTLAQRRKLLVEEK